MSLFFGFVKYDLSFIHYKLNARFDLSFFIVFFSCYVILQAKTGSLWSHNTYSIKLLRFHSHG